MALPPQLLALIISWLGKKAWNSDTVQGWRDEFGEKWDNRPISPNQGYYVPSQPSTRGITPGEQGRINESGLNPNFMGPTQPGTTGGGEVIRGKGGDWIKAPDGTWRFYGDGAMRPNEVSVLPPSWLNRAAPRPPDVTPGGVRMRGPMNRFDDTNDGVGLMVAPWRNDPGAGPTGPPGGGGEDPGGGGRGDEPDDPWVITPTSLPNYTPLSGGPSWLAWQPGNTGTPAIVGPKED